MIPWFPELPPDQYSQSWFARAFGNLKVGTDAAKDHDRFRAMSEEPPKTFAGMVIQADGDNWNPGYGAGMYIRDLDNSGWVPI